MIAAMRDELEEPAGLGLSWMWLTLAAAGATTLIITLVLMLADATRERDESLRLQVGSSDRIILAATFESTMARSEAALGRFVISGDTSLGTVYADNWRRSGLALERLAQISRNAEQRARLATMRTAWSVRGRELGDVAIRTTYRQNSEALSYYYKIRTSGALDQLTTGIEGFIEYERNVLGARGAKVDAQISRANLLTTLVSIVGVLVVTGTGILAFVALRAAQRRAVEEERSKSLEEAVDARTAELTATNARLLTEMATREDAEAKLRQAHKMDAVGQLTGGIAHDFNNMLAVILGGIELAKRRLIDGKENPGRHLDSALEGANRAAALTKRLLAFARSEPLLPSAVDPDALIAGMSDLLDRTLGERIIVRHVSDSGGAAIFADRHQLENAILNLAVNARDAVDAKGSGTGTLTISTASVALMDEEISGLSAGAFVRIAISDTGVGMDRTVMDRVFEPFFTTKAAGDGTGLGLSQVFGFVRQSYGTVTVDSVVGSGTTVSIYLPVHQGVAEAVTGIAVDTSSAIRTEIEILVVEDDRRVLTATMEALRELGHQPVECFGTDGAESILQAHPDVTLIVSDVLMPGMTGPELIQVFRRSRPELRAIYVTGYAGDAASAEDFGDDVVLRKPFTINALQAAIDAALSDGSPRSLETRAAA
jgi:signal transduction histidine kinase/CheY-like chemotaxis protein